MKRLFGWVAIGLIGVSTPAFAAGNEIEQAKSVTLRIGQSAVISGLTGKCGRLPMAADQKSIRTQTGIIGYGREGLRKGRACGHDPCG